MPVTAAEQIARLNEQNTHLAYRIEKAEAEIENLHREMDARAAEEKRRLIWGISILGAAVVALAKIIWAWKSVILRGDG